MRKHVRTRAATLVAGLAALAAQALTACTVAGAGADGDDVVTVGYQSKTINTVTAGTLLRERGFFERELEKLGEDGESYDVEWLDYDTGAPITAQMLAGKIDIGSMGDYPMLINGSRAGTSADTGTQMVSITGYNSEGALNGVVVDEDSPIEDLDGTSVSASVGSAGHGTLVQALDRAGIDPEDDVSIENQQPSVGSSALDSGSVDALSQFVAWPGLLAFRDDARLVYDGGQLDVPTLHGVVTRNEFADSDPDVVDAFLRAQIDATNYLHEHPVESAEIVAEETGLPAEVVYLYNGRNGVATFDTTVKPELTEALDQDLPFLESIGVLEDPVDLDEFVDDGLLRDVYGDTYAADTKSLANPAAITGRDEVCDRKVGDPAVAGELWVDGEQDTRPAADPACLLRNIAEVREHGDDVRAPYIPDATTGTRWFADRMVWLRDDGLLPFATQATADAYLDEHPQAEQLDFEAALEAA